MEITARNQQRLEQLAEITEARYRVGKAMQQDVLRARLEISMLLQRTAALRQQQLTAAARLNTLMGRPAGSPLASAAEPARSPLPAMEALAAAGRSQRPDAGARGSHGRARERGAGPEP